jgi:hypothetical protein
MTPEVEKATYVLCFRCTSFRDILDSHVHVFWSAEIGRVDLGRFLAG